MISVASPSITLVLPHAGTIVSVIMPVTTYYYRNADGSFANAKLRQNIPATAVLVATTTI